MLLEESELNGTYIYTIVTATEILKAITTDIFSEPFPHIKDLIFCKQVHQAVRRWRTSCREQFVHVAHV